MFSARSGFPRAANRWSLALERRRAAGAPLFDLTLSNPTRAGFRFPAGEALRDLADPAGRDYAPEPFGRRAAREAVARTYAEAGHPVDPDRIVLVASTSEAYGFLLKLLCDDGDEVAFPAPSYPLVDYLAALEGATARRYRLERHGRFGLDIPALEAALGPRTRAVLTVGPNNPTGNVLQPHERQALDELAGSRGLAVVSDEVFADFPFPGGEPAPVLAAAAERALTFSLGGISKACGLPQLKLGWIVAGGPQREVNEALARLEIIADTWLSVSTPVQVALPRLLAGRHAFQHECRERLARNRAALATVAAAIPGVELAAADGGWYACLRVPRTCAEEELVLDLLERDGVAVHPGYFFDFAEEAWLVLSLLVPPGPFDEGVCRILARLV